MLQGEKEEIYQKNFEMELSLKKYTESQKFDKEIIKDTKDKKMPISVNIINNKLGKEVKMFLIRKIQVIFFQIP